MSGARRGNPLENCEPLVGGTPYDAFKRVSLHKKHEEFRTLKEIFEIQRCGENIMAQ